MTRVLSVDAAGEMWGSERALLDLIDSIRDLEVAICCPPNTPLETELKRRDIRSFPFFIAKLHLKSRWQRLQAALGVLLACLIFRPDVIHINQSGAFRVVLFAATLLNLSVVSHVRIFEDVAYLARQRPKPQRLKALVAISRAIEDEIAKFPALQPIVVRRIYDAYSPTRLESSSKRVRCRVACVGRITPIKGQEILLRALQAADLVNDEVETFIVGDGDPDYVQSLRRSALKSGAAQVSWVGFVTDVAPLLHTCAVLVCPSHREPLGRVIFEAWDAGVVPVVFAGAGGAAEVVRGADGGLIYAEQTPECLARVLSQALRLTTDERMRLISNGRAWLTDNCSPLRCGGAIAVVFAQAAS